MNAAFQILMHGLRKPRGKPQLTVFGDSTAFGVAATEPANNWANKQAVRLGLTLVNQAISGTVMQNRADSGGSPRPNNGRSRYITALLQGNVSSKYKFLYGLNDLRYTAAPATLNLDNFIIDYRAVLQGLISFGVSPLDITVGSPVWMPNVLNGRDGYATGSAGFTGSSPAIHEQYIAALYALCYELGVKYAPVYEYMRDNGGLTLVDPDNIHPNDAGHAAIDVAFTLDAVPATSTWPNSPIDGAAPIFVSAVATANLVTLTYNETLSATLTGTPTLSGHGITSATVSGATVQIVPSTPITYGETLTITTPAGYVRDIASTPNLAPALTAQAITNNVPQPDTTEPTAPSAAVANGAATVVRITFSEAMNQSFVPAASAFTVSGHTVSSVAFISSTVLGLTVDAFVNGEAARTAAYTQPGTNNLRDLAGNLLASFSGLAITNNVAGAGPTPVTATFASTNANWRTVATDRYDSSIGTTTFDGIARVSGSFTVGTEAWVDIQFNASDAGGAIVLDPSSALTAFTAGTNRAYLAQLINDGRVFQSINGVNSAAMTTAYTFPGNSAGSRMRLHCSTGGVVTIDTTVDDGVTWTQRMVLGTTLTAGTVMYFRLYATNQRDIYQPRMAGLS